MKLIIDIPNRIFDGAKTNPNFYPTYDFEIIWKAILNSIPLDNLRTEIEQIRLHKAQFLTNDNKVCIDSQEVLNVIDKYNAERSK